MDPVFPQSPAPEPNDDLPGRVAAELRAAGRRMDADLSGLDDAVLGMARQRIGRRSARSVLMRVGWGMAAAAAIGLGVWGGWTVWFSPRVSNVEMASRVTILDAFALARMIESKATIEPKWDVNGDGLIDQRDVDALAAQAVRVSGLTLEFTSPERSEGPCVTDIAVPSLRSGLVNAGDSRAWRGGI